MQAERQSVFRAPKKGLFLQHKLVMLFRSVRRRARQIETSLPYPCFACCVSEYLASPPTFRELPPAMPQASKTAAERRHVISYCYSYVMCK